ncbi:polysaccharide biosynthesis/export family protein [Bradyrhizobium retamae]|uniref:Sugar ABC transporter substrate-binding protein n=1 Tax=Bradyrhizobium retamae TaxID=1300035 RepID=A0A0R3MFC4_9BRAD|nr:polysaccharide biosynthesis/export family protein [Bradyrhizobium retamae]KRR18682.1 sugar ABC transporter substrate-binding protein [Bradyrhizobium retamae]
MVLIRTLHIGATIAVGIMTLLCAGCIITPGSGPLGADVQRAKEGSEPAALPYALVKLTPEVVNILGQHIPRLSTAFAAQTPPKAFRFGIGDIVSVTIFEAAAGGLFTSDAGVRAGNFVTIPNQAVDEQGNISVPYAGSIRAKGRTPFEISKEITDKLKARALEPQVVVNLATQNTSLITVLGDVRNAGRFPASPSGERVLDAIARAGGPSAQGYDTWVSLKRMGHRASVPFGALMYEPANDIYVLPNDVIYLFNMPQTFVGFGAGGTQGLFKFDSWRLSLAEAIGKQGGLNDSQADPASVYLYRGETRAIAKELGVDVTQFQGEIIPIIFHVNLRDPSGYFLAQSFAMRNKDVIYTSNSVSVETTKFLVFLRTIMATVNDPIIYATNFFALKAAASGTGTTTIITTPPPITTTTP